MQGDEAKEGAGSAGADRLGELQARVERLGNLFTQLEGARAAARRTRVGITILLLIVAVGYGYALLHTLLRVQRDEVYQKQVVDAANEQLAKMVREFEPVVREKGGKILDKYLAEFKTQGPKAWPEIQEALEKEAVVFQNNAAEKAETTLRKTLGSLATRQEERVREAFDIKTDEDLSNVMDNLNKALASATADVLEEKFGKSQKRYVDITEKVTRLLPEDRRETFLKLADRFWMNLLLDQLKGMDFLKPLITSE